MQQDHNTIVIMSSNEIKSIMQTFNESQANICALEEELHKKSREYDELETVSERASISINEFHKQQNDLFNEFVVLRKKYDEQKVYIKCWFVYSYRASILTYIFILLTIIMIIPLLSRRNNYQLHCGNIAQYIILICSIYLS